MDEHGAHGVACRERHGCDVVGSHLAFLTVGIGTGGGDATERGALDRHFRLQEPTHTVDDVAADRVQDAASLRSVRPPGPRFRGVDARICGNARGDHEDPSERSRLDKLFRLDPHGHEAQLVIHEGEQIGMAVCNGSQLSCLCGVERQRLFAQHVLACRQDGAGLLDVEPRRRGDGYQIYRHVQHLAPISYRARHAMPVRHVLGAVEISRRDHDDFESTRLERRNLHAVRPSGADHSHLYGHRDPLRGEVDAVRTDLVDLSLSIVIQFTPWRRPVFAPRRQAGSCRSCRSCQPGHV
jgi:hypothetical protein